MSYIAEKELSIRRQKIFLDNFFNNLLIWGAQGEEAYPNEEIFEFYSYKGLKIIKEACDVLNKNLFEENLMNDINKNIIYRKNFLLNNLKIAFRKILNVMQNLEIDSSGNNNNKNKRDSFRISNLNSNSNFKEKLIMTEDDEDEINTNNTNKNNDINTKLELSEKNNLIDDNHLIIEKDFYGKLNDIMGNFKLFRTLVGHNGSLRMDEREQFFCLLLKCGIIN